MLGLFEGGLGKMALLQWLSLATFFMSPIIRFAYHRPVPCTRKTISITFNLPSYTQYWIDVLRSGSLFKALDQRDRIYGALGLLTSGPIELFARLPPDPES